MLQLEGVLQANLNLQAGVATAEAEFGPVTVEQEGPLTAGLDGIDATSEAVAIADFEQEADQSNDDFEGHHADGTDRCRRQPARATVPAWNDCGAA